jgi:hypothetical protein
MYLYYNLADKLTSRLISLFACYNCRLLDDLLVCSSGSERALVYQSACASDTLELDNASAAMVVFDRSSRSALLVDPDVVEIHLGHMLRRQLYLPSHPLRYPSVGISANIQRLFRSLSRFHLLSPARLAVHRPLIHRSVIISSRLYRRDDRVIIPVQNKNF